MTKGEWRRAKSKEEARRAEDRGSEFARWGGFQIYELDYESLL